MRRSMEGFGAPLGIGGGLNGAGLGGVRSAAAQGATAEKSSRRMVMGPFVAELER